MQGGGLVETEIARPGDSLTLGALGRQFLALCNLWRLPLALSVAGVAGLYIAADLLAPASQQQAIQFGLSIASFVVGYAVTVGLLKASGSWWTEEGKPRISSYFGLSFVIGAAVLLGLVCLVLPGLFLLARWMIAYPILLAQGHTIGASLSKSWDLTSGVWLHLIGAQLILMAPMLALVFTGYLVTEFAAQSALAVVLQNVAISAWSIASIILTVAAYRLLVDKDDRLAGVFA